MFFDLSDDQLALQALTREVLDDLSPPDRLRRAPTRDEAWPKLAAAGLTGIGLPVPDGGSGGGAVEAAVVAEEAGYVALPEPLVETLGVVIPGLREAADPRAVGWLTAVAAGDRIVDLAHEQHVANPALLDGVLLEHAGAMVLCPADRLQWAERRSREPSRPQARILAPDNMDVVALGDAAPLRLRAAAATAAAMVGLARRLLDIAVDHARVREQFGAPIGSFQAVAHPLASVCVEVEAARGAVWYAAYALDRDLPDAMRASRIAKVAADTAVALADRVSLQVLGGIGFTWEHDLHLLLKRAAAWRAAHGDGRVHRRYLGAALFDGEG